MSEISEQNTSHFEQYFCTKKIKENLKTRSIRGGTITILQQLAKLMLQIGSTMILARMLTPEDYGLVGMVKATTGFIELFRNLGLNTATIQREEINHHQVSTLFWINLGVSMVSAVVTIALAPVIAWFFGETRLVSITLALSVCFIFSGIGSQHAALMSRQMRYRSLAVLDLIAQVISLGVGIIAAWFGAKYWALILITITNSIILAFGFWLQCGWRPGLPHWNLEVKAMLLFGGGLTSTNVINYLTRNFDNILIGKYWGAQELGLYSRAYQLLMMPLLSINAPLRVVAVNTLSRLVDSPQRYRQTYLRMLEKIIMVTMPFVAFLVVTADWMVLILLGPKWSAVSDIFRWFSFSAFVQPIEYTTGWLLISQGRTWEMFRFWLFTGGITVAAFIGGLPWKSSGVAAAYSITGLLINTPLQYWFIGRSGPIRMGDFYRTSRPSLFATGCVFLVLFAFRQEVTISNPLFGLVIAFILSVGTALLAFAVLPSGRLALQDWRNVLTLIIKKQPKN
ncbi:lipopolysaccharide biosynthesis protein [Aphanothece hegewaldii CCALA 016]|uniref:Lipopolysaccharide biosynthesis protein n=1 Tax=Aphanothece hegewaldii CCALA 016 TaxID=2107694 RepID=A0A2T1M1S8_9CHRO|nr:lipopolysaccharide biosynthesis protein [Aphanothece hegewaldii]PSF38674.1 lipopolysaccharide biosynthesis protein [Aphanothece hegewaldii CCALA 016]